MTNIIAWIVLGLIAGAIAKAVDPAARGGGGIIGTMLLGIIGAFVGGTLASLLSGHGFTIAAAGLNPVGIVVAVIGAIIAVFVWHRIAGTAV